MTHAERATIKRQMSIGEHRGENDLNRAWSVTTYVHANGEKYRVTGGDGQFCTWVPGGAVCEESLEKLREAVIVALAEKSPAVPVPGSIAWVGIDWGMSPYMAARYLYNERQNDLYRRLMEVCGNQIVPPYER